MTDWPSEIAAVVRIHDQLRQVDGLWDYHLPEPGADEPELQRLEARVGSSLPAEYRGFLAAADGWTSVLQDYDLWPASVLTDPTAMAPVRECADVVIRERICPEIADEPDAWLLIGGSLDHPDEFLLALDGSPHAGQVRWVSESEIEAFADFREFFRALADHNRVVLRQATQRGGGAAE